MNRFARTIATTLALLALVALFPPGPSRAQADTVDPTTTPAPVTAQAPGVHALFLPLVAGSGAGAPAPSPAPSPTPVPSPAPVPDLVFTPNTVALAPGQQASVGVRVEPQADLRGATFELPGVQVGVSSSFEAAADGTSGTLTIDASALSEAAEQAVQVEGRSGDGTNGWVGRLTVTTSTLPGARTLFVDPAGGNDANDGAQARPFKTLTKALMTAKPGDTVRLAGGTYSNASNGEGFGVQPLLVPAQVSIIGTLNRGAKTSILKGTSVDNALSFQGDATMNDLDMRGFGSAVFTRNGKQTFSNLLLFENGLGLNAGSALTTLIRSDIALSTNGEGVRLFGQGRFTMKGGSITDAHPGCDAGGKGISFSESAQAMLTGVHFLNIHGPALSMRGDSKATVIDATISKNDGACTGAIGITAQNSVSLSKNILLTLKNTNISGYPRAGVDLVGNVKLVMDGGTISQNGIGINTDPTTIVDSAFGTILRRPDLVLTGVSLNTNQTAIRLSSGRAEPFKLRKSSVIGNGTGIQIERPAAEGCFISCADLGTSADPGNNTITGNTTTGVFAGRRAGVNAVGNTWNPSTQAADSSGSYGHTEVTGATLPALARGLNFFLDGGTETFIRF